MDDHELEQAMRRGLERRAARADASAPVAARALTAVRRRRAGRTGAVLAAAAVVVVAGVAVAVDRDEPSPGRGPAATDSTGPVTAWRTEYWHGLAVEVPTDWGWGAAPLADGEDGAPLSCPGPGAVQPEEDAGAPYVGRPVMLSDVCVMADQVGRPRASYLWFDAAVEPGAVELGGGFVQETVEVAGSRLTVGSADAALRERVLASVGEETLCLPRVQVGFEEAGSGATARGDVARDGRRLTVCAYRADRGDAESADLVYATALGRDALRAYLAALSRGESPRDQCPALDYAEVEWVVLEVGDAAGEVLRRDVVHLFCPGVDVGTDLLRGLETVRLTPAMVEPWAGPGVKAVVSGPSSGPLTRYFIGPQG